MTGRRLRRHEVEPNDGAAGEESTERYVTLPIEACWSGQSPADGRDVLTSVSGVPR